MKIQNLLNLVKYHVEKKDLAFTNEVAEIARDFDSKGKDDVAQYLMELIATPNFYVPQMSYKNLNYLRKIDISNCSLMLPSAIEQDILGIIRAIDNKSDLSKFLFWGKPGTGKTASAYQIARILSRDVLSVDFEQLVDSRLGETAKNVVKLFDEINHLQYEKVVVVFDEIDALVLDRVNSNDLREMGRVTSVFLRELESLNKNVVLIATTNLFDKLDKAILRRFDATISFNRYSSDDLVEIADYILNDNLKKTYNLRRNTRLFNKILRNAHEIPYPGDLRQIIKTSIAFSDATNEYDYLRKIYLSLNPGEIQLERLKNEGYTVREMEILTKVPKSSVSRKLRTIKNE